MTKPLSRGAVDKAVPAVVAHGFTLQGEISLFGSPDLTATLKVWQGPFPPGAAGPSSLIPCAEMASLNQEQLRLSSVAPGLAGTAFDAIVFRRVQIFHQNCAFDPERSVGWHLDADWVVDASCGSLHDVLRRVLGVDRPTMPIRGELGPSQTWTSLVDVQSVKLEGQFAGPDVVRSAPSGLQFTTLGIRLLGTPGQQTMAQHSSGLLYSYAAFGKLRLDIPASTAPLELSYDIHEAGGQAMLRAELGSAWPNAFAVTGLTIAKASFTTTLPVTSPWKSVEFDVAASFKHKGTQIDFQGTYAPGGAFLLKATLDPFDVGSIRNIFDALHGCPLAVPNIDLKIQSANISVASGKGLQVILNKVELAGHTAATAVLTASQDGVVIRGNLEDKVELGDVVLKSAHIQLTLPSSSNQNRHGSDAVVAGQVEVLHGLVVDATAHLYRGKKAKGYEWTVVAALMPKEDDAWALSRLVPEVRGTTLDLGLTQAVFVAASQDNPEVGSTICSSYAVRKGIQFHGTISGGIASLDLLTRKPHKRLTLCAGPSTKGFDIELFTPSETCISLGNGMKTTPIELKIETRPAVRLVISAGLSITVAGSSEPLTFGMTFDAGVAGASATGEMEGWWVNPCNAGHNVKLGPNLALELEIVYAQFVSTGSISGFGLRGSIMIGKTEAQCAMQISEGPTRNMLLAEIGALGLEDLVSFLHDVTGDSIPPLPDDCLAFEKAKLYICPAGVTLSKVDYPQGCSFVADMILFGKRADIACTMSKAEGLCIQGGVDNFELGPLTVRGTAGPRATVGCTLGRSSQHISVDGVVTFLEADVEIHVDISTLPEKTFTFFLNVAFADELTFKLHAELQGHLSFDRNLSKADFDLDAELEQHVLEHIRVRLLAEFEKARHDLTDGIEAADKSLQMQEENVDQDIREAKSDVSDAFQKWEPKQDEATGTAKVTAETYKMEVGRLEDRVRAARSDYDAATKAANTATGAAGEASRISANGAVEAMDAARQGSCHVALEAAVLALDEYKRLNEEAYLAACRAVNGLARCVQSAAHESAMDALSAADSAATVAVDATRKALDVAHEASDFALDIADRAVGGSLETLEIRHVRLSGSLRGLVTCSNSTPLRAYVEVVLLGHNMPAINVAYDPRDSVAFITTIFKEIWKNLHLVAEDAMATVASRTV